jgi:Rps23 Pro-64 3,4-dihydroxylase Tpa1-like proline 4-hydroxylase
LSRLIKPSYTEGKFCLEAKESIKPMNQVKNIEEAKKLYPSFTRLNGEHPFKTQVPEGRVEYQARYRKGGKVAFFNFSVAKEMGLIAKSHPETLNPELEKEILKTFSLTIINEWDIENKVKIPEDEIYPHTYMATRYLQLQHPDKTGKTSGDGRTIWNGTIRNNGISWDVSSCGTGGTKLSPACNINKKFYQTGDPSISYGCGLSEVGEGLETLFFSEVLGKNGFKTERILAIIEFDKGISINVRANPNLLRPSHFFSHLKQGNYQSLKQVADYYIQRQIENKCWQQTSFKSDKEKYFYLAKQVSKSFAETAAKFEDEYIFCWLDWDGDNILMDGGIIDYGSIRQFGLFHAEYRYDDVQRFSTSILEQRQKARYIVQCFAQIADFLSTGKKKSLSQFRNHAILSFFDHHFDDSKNRNLLQKIGFKRVHQDYLLKEHLPLVLKFRKSFSYFERSKAKRGIYKVADGINRDAIFCMRDILRELPQIYLSRAEILSPSEFIEVSKSSYAKKSDLKITPIRKKQIQKFQTQYMNLIEAVVETLAQSRSQFLLEITMRSSVINKYDRVTGDSISYIVEKVQKLRPKLKAEELFHLAQHFSAYQTLDPDQKKKTVEPLTRQKNIMQNLYSIVRECREGL